MRIERVVIAGAVSFVAYQTGASFSPTMFRVTNRGPQEVLA